MTKRILVVAATAFLIMPNVSAQNAAVPSPKNSYISWAPTWRQELYCAVPCGHIRGECDYLIRSSIYTDVTLSPSMVKQQRGRYGMLIKVSAWGRPYTGTCLWPGSDSKTTNKEIFTVTAAKTDDPAKMKVEYEDTVYEKGDVKLQFSGVTFIYTGDMPVAPLHPKLRDI